MLLALADVHAAWLAVLLDGDRKRPLHPLAPIVLAWIERPREVRAEVRDDPLFPAPVTVRADSLDKGGYLPPGLVLDRHDDVNLFLPHLEPPDPDIPPSLALTLYDLGIGNPESDRRTRVHGAPLALRLFVEAVLSVPASERGHGAVMLPPERWGDFLTRLYPSGKFQASRQWAAVAAAFDALDRPEALIPWRNFEGGYQLRRAVVVRDRPLRGHKREWVQLSVDLPPGSGKGAIADKLALRKGGAALAPAYRLELSLTADWHRPGRTRFPRRKGSHYLQVRDPNRYLITPDDRLIRMAFPVHEPEHGPSGDAANRKRLQRAREALSWLDWLEGKQYAEVHYLPDGRRIIPGPKWAGWTK